jgi:hypothetical protein
LFKQLQGGEHTSPHTGKRSVQLQNFWITTKSPVAQHIVDMD